MKTKRRRIRSRSFIGVLPNIFIGGRTFSLIFISLSCLLLLFSVVKPQSVSGIRLGVGDMVSPLISTVANPIQGLVETVSNISGLAAMQAENDRLRAENVRLKEWYQTALMLQAENKSLQELLNLKVEPLHNFVTARVISDSGNSYVKTLLIKAGVSENIRKDQAVLSGEGMIGRIVEAGRNSSRVLLLTDVNSRLPVIVEGSNQKAILTGDNTNTPLLKHLPIDSGVTVGDRVVTSGDGGVFKPGHSIGRITKNKKGDFAVQLFANMDRLTYVRVLDKNTANSQLIDN